MLIRAGRLAEDGKSYVLATVVRVERPASTRPGDRALILPDGRLDGWVGGACSEPIVIREAMRALEDGEPRVVRIGPSGSGDDAPDDIVIAESSCASEGTVEVLVEPQLPRPLLVVVGDSKAAITLVDLARAIEWRVATEQPGEADAVVVATMGHADEDALELALGGRAGYVGLVASARRAGVVLDALRARGVSEDDLARVRSPAGLDLGPATQPEIAVAILAELVAWRHTRGGGDNALLEAVDPICGMTVAVAAAGDAVVFGDVSYYFCSPGCRSRFEADPARYATAKPLSLQAARTAPRCLPDFALRPGRLCRRVVLPEAEVVPFGVLAGREPAHPGNRHAVVGLAAELLHARDARVDVVDVEVHPRPASGRSRPP